MVSMRRLLTLSILFLAISSIVLGVTVRPVYPVWKFPQPDYHLLETAILIAIGIGVFLAGLFYSIRKYLFTTPS